ncbi:urocortin isoform X1 [Cuculus canorus]|uniref:urocortin isoform X1 n=2 Tax=Cuculus canorus TaxID=55661 RepID=UPI0023AA3346|nr:urocortin isoform X1 [Cuculus canorus]
MVAFECRWPLNASGQCFQPHPETTPQPHPMPAQDITAEHDHPGPTPSSHGSACSAGLARISRARGNRGALPACVPVSWLAHALISRYPCISMSLCLCVPVSLYLDVPVSLCFCVLVLPAVQHQGQRRRGHRAGGEAGAPGALRGASLEQAPTRVAQAPTGTGPGGWEPERNGVAAPAPGGEGPAPPPRCRFPPPAAVPVPLPPSPGADVSPSYRSSITPGRAAGSAPRDDRALQPVHRLGTGLSTGYGAPGTEHGVLGQSTGQGIGDGASGTGRGIEDRQGNGDRALDMGTDRRAGDRGTGCRAPRTEHRIRGQGTGQETGDRAPCTGAGDQLRGCTPGMGPGREPGRWYRARDCRHRALVPARCPVPPGDSEPAAPQVRTEPRMRRALLALLLLLLARLDGSVPAAGAEARGRPVWPPPVPPPVPLAPEPWRARREEPPLSIDLTFHLLRHLLLLARAQSQRARADANRRILDAVGR